MEAFTRFLVTAGIRFLEAIFAVGIVGSAVVIVLTGIEDFRDMFRRT